MMMNDIPYADLKEKIVTAARKLRIPDLAKFEGVITPGAQFEVNLLELLDAAVTCRMEKSLARRLSQAGLDPKKSFDTFVATQEGLPNINADDYHRLRDCSFIGHNMDVVMVGPVGRGKSHLAMATGIEAVKRGEKVLFVNADKMLTSMLEAKEKKALGVMIEGMGRYDLLIIDELGYSSYSPDQTNMLFKIICERYEKHSTIITTNREFSQWSEFMSDEQLIVAIMDRLVHHSIILNMGGPESYRRKEAMARKKPFLPLPSGKRTKP